MPVNRPGRVPSNNLFPSVTASVSGHSFLDPYDVSSDDEEYLTPNNVAETTPRRSDRVLCWLTTAWLDLNPLPAALKNWQHTNPNFDDCYSDPMDISSIFWILDISNWLHQQEETQSKYTDLSNLARDIISIIPHGVGVVASVSLARDVMGWRQSKTSGETLR